MGISKEKSETKIYKNRYDNSSKNSNNPRDLTLLAQRGRSLTATKSKKLNNSSFNDDNQKYARLKSNEGNIRKNSHNELNEIYEYSNRDNNEGVIVFEAEIDNYQNNEIEFPNKLSKNKSFQKELGNQMNVK